MKTIITEYLDGDVWKVFGLFPGLTPSREDMEKQGIKFRERELKKGDRIFISLTNRTAAIKGPGND